MINFFLRGESDNVRRIEWNIVKGRLWVAWMAWMDMCLRVSPEEILEDYILIQFNVEKKNVIKKSLGRL